MKQKTVQKIFSAVKKTYNKIAKDFSQTRNQGWEEFKLIDKYLTKNCKLADIGCGNGRLATYLEAKQVSYTGIDNSKELIKLAKELHPQQKFILGDFIDIPLEKNSQDIIACIASFHHIPSKKARKKATDNLYKTLNKEGVLIVTVWNLWQKKYRKYILKAIINSMLSLGNYHPLDTFIPWGEEKEARYYHAFLPSEMKSYLKRAGFTLLETKMTKGEKTANIFNAYNQVYICKK